MCNINIVYINASAILIFCTSMQEEHCDLICTISQVPQVIYRVYSTDIQHILNSK